MPSAAGYPLTSSSTGTRQMPGSFFDTNVLVYLASSDPAKANRAEAIVSNGRSFSVQALNKLANVARRKMSLSWDYTRTFLSTVRSLLLVAPITLEIHEH